MAEIQLELDLPLPRTLSDLDSKELEELAVSLAELFANGLSRDPLLLLELNELIQEAMDMGPSSIEETKQ